MPQSQDDDRVYSLGEMKIRHDKIVIELEGEEERRLLRVALAIAMEITNNDLRNEKVSPVCFRAGVDESTPRANDLGDVWKFAVRLHDSL